METEKQVAMIILLSYIIFTLLKLSSTNLEENETSVSDDEFMKITQNLWNYDDNRAVTSQDYVTNKQSYTSGSSKFDSSALPFFTSLNEELFEKPTYASFIALLDNYIAKSGNAEEVTQTELNEQKLFLENFCSTKIGEYLFQLFVEKNIVTEDISAFKTYLNDIWFGLYSRQRHVLDSCGFEHVFIGEVSKGKVVGLHNWLAIYLQEKSGNLNYYGYTNFKEPNLYGLHYEWLGEMKQKSSILVGSSPEYEIAIYTLCHVLRPNKKCKITMENENGHSLTRKIQTWKWDRSRPKSGDFIAAAYFL